jgi:ribonucleoside-diphosphate reductase alpha chain|tara:strand:+ start:1681 stop:3897 length:2217 start_codon:yes stop_codon:yes gene_type:complete
MATASVDTRKLLSETKFFDSYSRWNDDQNRYESWDEAVDRVMSMHEGFYNDKLNHIKSFIEEARTAYKEQRVLGAQRALQFGGEQILKHQMRMYNCTSSYADRAAFFGEIFYILLCGAGAGFSVQSHHVAKLPKIQARTKQPKTHVVEDSIEGWATAVDVLMSSYFMDGGKHPDYAGRRVYFDLSLIRPKGAKISGGFKAPGPDGLRLALDKIEHLLQSIVMDNKAPVMLRPIQVYDIVMHTADAVLSGGVRRSATICLFSPDDEEMMKAKTGNWFMDNPQRGRSNNSAVIVRDETTPEEFGNIMKSVREFGEPGFVFVESKEHTTNPCVEIGMYPQIKGKSGWQGCNLTEINGGLCNTKEDFFQACRAASILGTLQAGYTDFKFLGPVAKDIFDREALIGASITGWMNNPDILFDPEILEQGAQIVKDTNREVAKAIGINPAARTTCVKPSGNASVLLQTGSGIHAEHSSMYIRNVQMNKESEVTQAVQRINPHMVEESVWSAGGTDVVISFPIVPKEGSIFKDELVGVDHLEKVKLAQKHWVNAGTNEELCADKGVRHNVSNTIIVDDWDEVERYVFENRHSFAGISFLSATGDKDFNQAPNTAVISAKEMVDKYDTAAIFASGLVVDALNAFDNLWTACSTAHGFGDDITLESAENAMKRDWIRRFNNFANNYLDGDVKKAEYCLKDSYLLHKWNKINKNFNPINWIDDLTEKRYTEVDTMGAAACAGGACEIDF